MVGPWGVCSLVCRQGSHINRRGVPIKVEEVDEVPRGPTSLHHNAVKHIMVLFLYDGILRWGWGWGWGEVMLVYVYVCVCVGGFG